LPQGRDGDAAFMKLWQHGEANAKLRLIVADLPLEKAMLPDALYKRFEALPQTRTFRQNAPRLERIAQVALVRPSG
jgi:hypothetical protein